MVTAFIIFAGATIIIHLSPEYLERIVWDKTKTIRGETHDRIGHFQLQSETGSTLCRIAFWDSFGVSTTSVFH